MTTDLPLTSLSDQQLLAELAKCLEELVDWYVGICDANTSEAWDASDEPVVLRANDLIAEAKRRSLR